MSPARTAFYQSLTEMKQSYMNDLQMVANYRKALEVESGLPISEHIDLLQNQLHLIVDTIDHVMNHR